jgi:hypothetical protein
MATNATAKKATTSTTQTTTQSSQDSRAVNYVIQTAERSVDVPVGVALTVRDRVTDAVEPWTSSTTRDKELKSLRTQVTRELNKFERRGGQARRKATQRVRQTRNEKQVKDNRAKAEQQLKKARTAVQERVPSTTSAS